MTMAVENGTEATLAPEATVTSTPVATTALATSSSSGANEETTAGSANTIVSKLNGDRPQSAAAPPHSSMDVDESGVQDSQIEQQQDADHRQHGQDQQQPPHGPTAAGQVEKIEAQQQHTRAAATAATAATAAGGDHATDQTRNPPKSPSSQRRYSPEHEKAAERMELGHGHGHGHSHHLKPTNGTSSHQKHRNHNNRNSDSNHHMDISTSTTNNINNSPNPNGGSAAAPAADTDGGDSTLIRHLEEKCRKLKRKVKEYAEENERMGQELDRSTRRIRILRRSKNLLLDRLCKLENRDSESGSDSGMSLDSDSDEQELHHQHHSHHQHSYPGRRSKYSPSNHLGHSLSRALEVAAEGSIVAHHPKKSMSKTPRRLSPVAGESSNRKSNGHHATPSSHSINGDNIPGSGTATPKPKRQMLSSKQRPGIGKVRKVQPLEREEDGSVKLPVTIGILTVVSLGEIVWDRDNYHNDRYIWPIGYTVSRSYNSMIDPRQQTTYICQIIDAGDSPKFQIDAGDRPGNPIIANTATGAWTSVVKEANSVRKRDHSNSASGPDYFGFSHPTIAKLIQDLPNAEKCKNYVMQRFETMNARANPHASAAAAAASVGAGIGKRKLLEMAAASSLHTAKLHDGDHHEDGHEQEHDENDQEHEEGAGGEDHEMLDSPRPPKKNRIDDEETEDEHENDEIDELEGDEEDDREPASSIRGDDEEDHHDLGDDNITPLINEPSKPADQSAKDAGASTLDVPATFSNGQHSSGAESEDIEIEDMDDPDTLPGTDSPLTVAVKEEAGLLAPDVSMSENQDVEMRPVV